MDVAQQLANLDSNARFFVTESLREPHTCIYLTVLITELEQAVLYLEPKSPSFVTDYSNLMAQRALLKDILALITQLNKSTGEQP